MQQENLRKAVKALRLSIKLKDDTVLSQTEFGRLIGKSLNTIQRYETLVPPKGRTLLQLQDLAMEHGCHRLALIFRSALDEEMGEGQIFIPGELGIVRKVATDGLKFLEDAGISRLKKISLAKEAFRFILERTVPMHLRPTPSDPTDSTPDSTANEQPGSKGGGPQQPGSVQAKEKQ